MDIEGLLNIMRREAQKAVSTRASTKKGVVTGYDPDTYSVKVALQPEGTPTGWIPLGSEWVGNGWGMFAPPSIGDMVQVDFDEGDHQSGYVSRKFYNDQDRPLPCPSGEFWLVHQTGSLLKLLNNGDVELVTNRDLLATVGRHLVADVASDLTATVGGDATATVTGNLSASVGGNADLAVTGNMTSSATLWTHTGPVTVNGAFSATGNFSLTGNFDSTGTMTNNGKVVGSPHTHGNPPTTGAVT